MIVGCYSVDLYCDNEDRTGDKRCKRRNGPLRYGSDQYTGETEGECLRQARKEGWKFTRDRPRKAYCPACSGKRPS